MMIVTFGGSVGTDRSANAPTGPGEATSFTYNGTTLNLLTTVPVNPDRKSVEVNNTTGALAVVVMDDGKSTSGTVSLLALAAGAGANQQGAGWATQTEAGRIRVFGTTGTYCYVREN